ncbi:MAG: CPBP family intramembrane metalloprotease [Sinomicrobium sp.]|nr:CPBP family intramembrane metalloprotease [Sinomicrobium sp.]
MYIAQAFYFKHELWRYILGFLVVFIGSQFIGAIPIAIAVAVKMLQGDQFDLNDQWAVFSLFDPNVFLVLMLIPFALGFLALVLWVRLVHQQPFRSLHSAKQTLNWKKTGFAFGIWAFITIVFVMGDYYVSPGDYVWNFKLVPFLIMFFIAIVLIPIQTGFEEYIFRGYLMQGIGVRAGNRWVPLLGTSLLFGLLHIFNPEVDKIGYIALVSYIGSGLFLGIITLMDDGLELALGFHTANNLITVLLVTADWTVFQTNSILKDVSAPSAGVDIFIPVFLIYPLLIFVFARKYGWTGWREKLFGNVVPPQEMQRSQ